MRPSSSLLLAACTAPWLYAIASGCGGTSDVNLGPSADAAPDTTSGIPDASGDSTSPGSDTGTPGPDANPPPSDASTTGFCASAGTQHLFCDDFDSSTNLKAKWDAQVAVGPTNAQLDTAIVKSAPNSYLAQTTQPVNVQAVSVLEKRFTGIHAFAASFDVYVEAYGSDPQDAGPNEFIALQSMQSGPLSLSLLVLSPDVAGIAETSAADGGTGMTTFYAFSGPAGLGKARWVHVAIAGTYPTSNTVGHVSVRLDGATVVDHDLASPALSPGDSNFVLGIYAGRSPNLWSVHFDNVLVDRG